MWKTSFIQFFKIIQQNKFFTFLNLFGVSITIMIILIAAIIIESTIWPGGVEKNNDQMLFMDRLMFKNENNMSIGSYNLLITEDYLAKMESPEAIGFSNGTPWSYFAENGVEEFKVRNTNAGWWQVFDFNFIEGRPYNKQEVKDGAMVVVIDQMLKNKFFQNKIAIGEMLDISGKSYKVVGVIENVASNCSKSAANVYMPYTLKTVYERNLMRTGSISIAFRGRNKQNLEEIKAEATLIHQKISPMLENDYKMLFGGPDTALGVYLRGWTNLHEYQGDKAEILKLLAKFLLLMLLPALNLISIQLIRIHERAEEIGVRKAFGAYRGKLIRQIIYENTLLTFLGALMGLAFTLILVYGFKDFLMHTLFHTNGASINLSINFGLFIISLIASLVLSILSGLIPAIKMSKIQAAEVLKGGEL